MKQRQHVQVRGRDVVGLLDVGSSKVVCIIAALDPSAPRGSLEAARVIGIGQHISRGIKSGVITNLEAAEEAILGAVSAAEDMAGLRLESVIVSISCGRLRSQTIAAEVDIAGGVVRDSDVRRAVSGARAFAERGGRRLVHVNTTAFQLDGVAGGEDPRGLTANQLKVGLHAVSADKAPLRNLHIVVDRCLLGVRGIVVAAYASALAATSEEERQLGVTCIDIGGGTTSVAAFAEGKCVHTAVSLVGGNTITADIAAQLQTPVAEAERIKALYGTMVNAQSDEHEFFCYPVAGSAEGGEERMAKADLSRIVRPRVAQILASVRENIESCRAIGGAGRRVVLTGGGSQLVGLADFAANALGCPVRVAMPAVPSGLPQTWSGPGYATVVGLLLAGTDPSQELVGYNQVEAPGGNYLGRVGQWLMDGL